MGALYRFVDVRCEGADRPYSFTLHHGDTRMLQLASRDAKNAMIDCAIGESVCEGSVEIAQGDRRQRKSVHVVEERRRNNHPVPLIWKPVQAIRSMRVGWVAANGGLISNLKIWENVTLPLWYHAGYESVETEQEIVRWLGMLGVEQAEFERFMAAHPHAVELWQRKLAGLLRALVQKPAVLVVDAALLGNIKENFVQNWIMALETYAAEGGAVLLIADKAMTLQWERLE
jgi:ABC-type ATPase involved in cell division